jgi:hypothetical protein
MPDYWNHLEMMNYHMPQMNGGHEHEAEHEKMNGGLQVRVI